MMNLWVRLNHRTHRTVSPWTLTLLNREKHTRKWEDGSVDLFRKFSDQKNGEKHSAQVKHQGKPPRLARAKRVLSEVNYR